MRTNLGDITQGDICLHHYEQFINKYEKYQRRCADPGKIHKTPVHGSLRVISIDMAKNLHVVDPSIKPGMKLCPRCEAKAIAGEFIQTEPKASTQIQDEEMKEDPAFETNVFSKLDESITALGCSL